MKTNTFYAFCTSAFLLFGCASADDVSEPTSFVTSQALTDDATGDEPDATSADGPFTCSMLPSGSSCTLNSQPGECSAGGCCTGCVGPGGSCAPMGSECVMNGQPGRCEGGGCETGDVISSEKPAPDASLVMAAGPVPTCAVLADGADCTKWGDAGKCHSGECCTGCVNPVTGQCNYGIQPSACGNGGDACKNCDDGRACNTDKCIDYTCVHTSLCDDGDDCTADRCKSTGCEHYPEINGTPCNGVGSCLGPICQMPAQDEPAALVRAPDAAAEADALPITCAILAEGAHCTEDGEQGMCVNGGCCTWCPVWDGCRNPCDASDVDADQCGIGWCTPSGCCVMPQANAIADVDQHDADAMSSCRLFPEVCDDGNDCTNDVCTDTGCRNYFQSIGASCDNGDGVCSVAGICCHGCASAFSSAKAIKPCHLFPDACDDGNDCTDDVCTDYGCAHPASEDGAHCGLFDICRHGSCVDRCGTVADCPTPEPGHVPACIDSACVELDY